MRVHFKEVGQFRTTFVRELNILSARREMLEMMHRDIYQNRSDLPQVSAGAREIEACMQYLKDRTPQRSDAASGQRWTASSTQPSSCGRFTCARLRCAH
eukprot:6998299-Pyramimonas_sp.AAC.1